MQLLRNEEELSVVRTPVKTDERRPGETEWLRGYDCDEQGDFERAVTFYRQSAAKKYRSAYVNLGNLLDKSDNPLRQKEAVYWYKRAFREGAKAGAWNLAMHYRNRGVRRWYLHWLSRAAEMGEEDAIKALKQMKQTGRSMRKSN